MMHALGDEDHGESLPYRPIAELAVWSRQLTDCGRTLTYESRPASASNFRTVRAEGARRLTEHFVP